MSDDGEYDPRRAPTSEREAIFGEIAMILAGREIWHALDALIHHLAWTVAVGAADEAAAEAILAGLSGHLRTSLRTNWAEARRHRSVMPSQGQGHG